MRIELKLNTCRVEMECALCGSAFPMGDIVALAYDRNNELVGNICPDCLKLTPEQMQRMINFEAEKLRVEATELLAQAEAYKALAQEPIEMPSSQEEKRLQELIGS